MVAHIMIADEQQVGRDQSIKRQSNLNETLKPPIEYHHCFSLFHRLTTDCPFHTSHNH